MYDTDEDTLVARVDRGVMFLNATFPEWRTAIDLEELDLSDPEKCVIGQTFCHELMRERFDTRRSAWAMGEWVLTDFDEDAQMAGDELPTIAYGFEREGPWESYDLLQEEWLKRV